MSTSRADAFTHEEQTLIWAALNAYQIPEAEWDEDEEEAAEANANGAILEVMRMALVEEFE